MAEVLPSGSSQPNEETDPLSGSKTQDINTLKEEVPRAQESGKGLLGDSSTDLKRE